MSCAAIMSFNRLIATAPFAFLFSLGTGHTCVSCPHPSPLYLRNSPWPKNDFPSRVSFSKIQTNETTSLMSGPLIAPIISISPTSVEPSPPDVHDRLVHSVPPIHSLQTHRSPGCRLRKHLLRYRSISEIDILEPIQYDTDNAIPSVITYKICSLLPPCASMLRQQLDAKDSSARPVRPFPFRTGLASPHDPTLRVGVSNLI